MRASSELLQWSWGRRGLTRICTAPPKTRHKSLHKDFVLYCAGCFIGSRSVEIAVRAGSSRVECSYRGFCRRVGISALSFTVQLRLKTWQLLGIRRYGGVCFLRRALFAESEQIRKFGVTRTTKSKIGGRNPSATSRNPSAIFHNSAQLSESVPFGKVSRHFFSDSGCSWISDLQHLLCGPSTGFEEPLNLVLPCRAKQVCKDQECCSGTPRSQNWDELLRVHRPKSQQQRTHQFELSFLHQNMIDALKAALAPGDAGGQPASQPSLVRTFRLLAYDRAEELSPSYMSLIGGPGQMKKDQGRRYRRCVRQ